jgi:hypothetical protein
MVYSLWVCMYVGTYVGFSYFFGANNDYATGDVLGGLALA